ncbi:DNA topoisomerase 2-alpha-like [Clavelina lepadiformis]|uniref:DNA topoisomerase 2-alpha-like n=1 Tax=Clavelina lepadiformis TaxID=159417 RepID=UPI0040417068
MLNLLSRVFISRFHSHSVSSNYCQSTFPHSTFIRKFFRKPRMDEFDELPKSPSQGGGRKRLSVERIYQKKTQLEHILLRPDTYIGSVEPVTQAMWVWDEGVGMVNREITFVPGLYKIFDEIVVNAADNKQRDPKMSSIKIDINAEKNRISVWNDGKGIPVVEHKVEKLYVPEMIFGHLLTSSNYNDEDKKVTGGRNGYGAKLCNIFSHKFTIETSSKEYGKRYKQSWSTNMSKTHERKLVDSTKSDFTCITFEPDLSKFHMTELDKDTVALLSRRAYDLAGSSPGVKIYLNGNRLPVKNFKDYVQLYINDIKDENGEKLKVVHEQVNPRWEICLTSSDKGFQQISFVNSIATTKGGRHIDYVMDQVSKKLIEVVKKKNKGGVDVKPYQIKNHCWLFVNCLVENPTFDSQTKENMTLQTKKFGSQCSLTDKFLKMAGSSGIVDSIMNWVKFKAQSQLQKKSAGKSNKLKGVPKLDDANDAGTKHSLDCTLILTEGDSAKTLAVSGLSVVGRDKYGVFPLRGKLLNVRDASHKQIMENAEVNNIIKIMGLKYNKKYELDEDLKSLRYGKLMIMTDQDHDGSHIKGLLINFIHSNWPNMLQRRMLEEFITPIVKVTKGSQVLSFYTIPEFEEWQSSIENSSSWKVKYYKGLGTSTSKEAKAYFADMSRHRVRFKYSGPDDDGCIDMAFNKKRADDRKDWLTSFMEERRRCRVDSRPEPGADLYNADTRTLSYKDFVNKELVMYSCADLERSVPSLVDGLKPGQRKVLYTCFRRNDKREVKVAQLAGSVAELSAYHHGEVSLQATIINMAQNYVGTNNVNLLQPIGQFGTRLHGGKDSASPRYIFTMLSPLTRLLFPAVDDNLLTFLYDDNQKVEPSWYCPIIPTILVNGSEGIGTGWSTRVPNHDVREVVANCRRLIRGEDPVPMVPSYKNFKGTIEELDANRYVVNGEVSMIDEKTLEITELPIRTWTQNYKESVLEPMALGTEKVPQQILEYKEYNTDMTVRFLVKMSEQKLKDADGKGLHKFFSLQTSMSCHNTLVLFDEFGCLRKFNNTTEILKEFFQLRMKLYVKRKDYLMGLLTAESKKLSNQARFILEKIEGKISIFNKAKKILIKLLQDRGYDSDPIKAWKEAMQQAEAENAATDDDNESDDQVGSDYNYILNMPLWSLSKERKEDLLKQRDAKQAELEALKCKTPTQLWKDDLDKFTEELDKVEQKEREDAMAPSDAQKKSVFGKGRLKGKVKQLTETKPSPHGIRVVPRIDPALKSRLTAGDKKPGRTKVKKEDPTVKKLDTYFKKVDEDGDKESGPSIDADEPPSLLSRLKKSGSLKAGTKQTTLGFNSLPKKKDAKKKNPWQSDSDDSEDDKISDISISDNSESDFVPKKKTRAAEKEPKKYRFDSDSDNNSLEDIDYGKDKTKPKNQPSSDEEDWKRKVKAKKSKLSSDDEDSEPKAVATESSDEELFATKAKPKLRVKTESGREEESPKPSDKWDEIMGVKPKDKKRAPLKRKKATKATKTSSASDGGQEKPPRKIAKVTLKKLEDSEIEQKKVKPTKPAPAKPKAAAKPKKSKKNAWSSSENEDDDDDSDESLEVSEPVRPRTTTGRQHKPAKYTFSDDGDSDF